MIERSFSNLYKVFIGRITEKTFETDRQRSLLYRCDSQNEMKKGCILD